MRLRSASLPHFIFCCPNYIVTLMCMTKASGEGTLGEQQGWVLLRSPILTLLYDS